MNRDLTKGSERKALILFSLPIIAGNLLQQLYNIADTLIVGKYLGPASLGAVGSSSALMILLTSIILGLCMGSGIVFSQLFGAKNTEDLKTSIFNSFFFTAIVTFLVFLISLILLPSILKWLQIPGEAYEETYSYLYIILWGMAFTFLYNFFASVLRSIGNSFFPLLFLILSSLLNIVLDIVFILYVKMGVSGAALATVISQGVSAVCITLYFVKKAKFICPSKKNCYFSKRLLNLIMQNSVLTSIQQSIMNFGILMIQGLVNSFGVAAMAAFAAVVKIDAFAYMPVQDFGNAFSTYIAQNYGANQQKRIKKGTLEAVKISSLFCILVSCLVTLFAEPLMLIFINASESEVLRIGISYLHIVGFCYIGIGCLFLLYGYFRGIGKPFMSIVLTIISLGTRVLLSYLLAPIPAIGLTGIWFAIPIGWVLADMIGFVFIWYYNRKFHC